MSQARSRILLTGGLGFIGQHLARTLLNKGFEVVLFDSLSSQVHGMIPVVSFPFSPSDLITIIRGSVLDEKALDNLLTEVDVIVHLAAETGTAQSMYEIARYNGVNTQGTATILDLLANSSKRRVKKVILASSRSVYGEGAYHCSSCGVVFPETRPAASLKEHRWDPECPSCGKELTATPTREDARTRPASIYAATKLAQEELVRIACSALGIPYVIFRFQNVFGEGQSLKNPYTGILSIFSTRIRQGLHLPIFEDGKETRDFVHVSDVAEAVALAAENNGGDGEILNVGSGRPTSVLQVAQLLTALLGGKEDIRVTREYRIGDIRHCYASMDKIRARLGFQPSLSIEDGMKRFVEWVRTQPIPEDLLIKANEELKSRRLMG